MRFTIEKSIQEIFWAMNGEQSREMMGYLQSMGYATNLNTPVTDVDQWYDTAAVGDRQHMANKLFKHGYVSPKAPKAPMATFDIERTGDNTQDIRRVLGKLRSAFSAPQVIETMAKMYDITFPEYLEQEGYFKKPKDLRGFSTSELLSELNDRVGA